MKYNLDAQDNIDKIPYDSQPIYRQTNTNKRRKPEQKAPPSKLLSIVVCLLVVLNVVLCGLVINLSKNSKPPETNIFNISTDGTLDVSAVADKTKSSVVAIHTGSISSVDANSFYSLTNRGSGIIIDGDKESGTCYILTCYHVVKNNVSNIWVLMSDSFNPVKASLVYTTAYSKMYDIAVLKLSSDEYKRSASKPCEIGNSSLVRDGDGVIAYGNPQGTGLSVTSGEISKTINLVNVDGVYNRLLKTSAPINGGNSGGGLFNAEGKLIGIVNAKKNDDPSKGSYIDNIAFAIPIDVAYSLAMNMLKNQRPLKAQTGLSFAIQNTNIVYEKVNGKLLPKQTILVKEITASSAGELAGFEVGDEIVSFSYGETTDVSMRNLYSLEDHIFNLSVGDTVVFKIKRGNVEKTLNLKIKNSVAADSQDWYR